MELAQAFASLGPNLLTLDLYFTELAKLSTDHLKQLKNSLPYLQTIYLEYDEMAKMGPEKVRILNEAFPSAEEIIVLDSTTATAAPDVIGRANLLKKLGFKVNVPSLVNQCAFFINRDTFNYDISSLPAELQEKVNSFF
ncbi:hypothetical protein [Legionella tunisiensis]|uniref:hypothetical protein n=1 Tax=Legionella tunisiensis TaxID=1034944 RepID=UPI0002D4F551|nr:hypothetical protein [Legionella tunisiensis]